MTDRTERAPSAFRLNLAHYANAKRPRVLELIALNEFPGAEPFRGMRDAVFCKS